MDNIYYHPKNPDTTTIECFISYLRDKRKLGEETDVEHLLEGILNLYLSERKTEVEESKMLSLLLERFLLEQFMENRAPKCIFCNGPIDNIGHVYKIETKMYKEVTHLVCLSCNNFLATQNLKND